MAPSKNVLTLSLVIDRLASNLLALLTSGALDEPSGISVSNDVLNQIRWPASRQSFLQSAAMSKVAASEA